MPGFLVEWVSPEKGFWWVILALFCAGTITSAVAMGFKKVSSVATYIISAAPIVMFNFYIHSVRGATGWLVYAILMAILFVVVLVLTIIGASSLGENIVVGLIIGIAIVGIALGVMTCVGNTGSKKDKPVPSNEITATINANANFRAGPTTKGDNIIRQLKAGDTIIITGEAENGWTPIKHGKEEGWISSEFVKKE